MNDKKTFKMLLALPSYATNFTLVDDTILNGTDGFSLNRMKISKAFFQRTTTDYSVICFKIDNENSLESSTANLNTGYYYDGINVPTENNKIFKSLLCPTDMLVYCNEDQNSWDYIHPSNNSDNVKELTIYVTKNGSATPLTDIQIDNRLIVELEFR